MKRRWRILFFLLGLAGLAVLIWQSDPANTPWSDLLDYKFFILMAVLFGLWAVIYVMHAMVYNETLKSVGANVGRAELLRICVSGFALNNVTPAGLVGGEPYRIMELKKYCDTERAASATLTFSILYVMGHFMLWTTGMVLYVLALIFGLCENNIVVTLLMVIFGSLTGLACFLFFRSKRHGFIMPVLRTLSHIPLAGRLIKKLIAKHGDQYTKVDDGITAFRSEPKRFWKSIMIQYGTRLLEGVEYFLILGYLVNDYVIFGKVNIISGILVMAMASLIGNLIFIIPLQAGTRETGMALALNSVGIDPSIGTLAGIIYRIRELTCILVGIVAILIDRKNKSKIASSADETVSEQQNPLP